MNDKQENANQSPERMAELRKRFAEKYTEEERALIRRAGQFEGEEKPRAEETEQSLYLLSALRFPSRPPMNGDGEEMGGGTGGRVKPPLPCTWTEPCNLAGCSRCERRHRYQAAKPVVVSAGRQAVPLSILRGISAPPIEPARLAELGPFLLTDGRTRASIEDTRDLVSRRQVVFQVEILTGELAGAPFTLYLVALDNRVQIVDLLRRTGGPVGPCLLTRHYLEPTVGVWAFCALEADGVLWDPFGAEQDPPEPGAAPVSFF